MSFSPAIRCHRCRRFPSLVGCCTVDWFAPWPPEALLSVGERMLSRLPELAASVPQQLAADASAAAVAQPPRGLVQRAAELAIEVHTSVEAAAERYKHELGRRLGGGASARRLGLSGHDPA